MQQSEETGFARTDFIVNACILLLLPSAIIGTALNLFLLYESKEAIKLIPAVIWMAALAINTAAISNWSKRRCEKPLCIRTGICNISTGISSDVTVSRRSCQKHLGDVRERVFLECCRLLYEKAASSSKWYSINVSVREKGGSDGS